LLLEAEAVRVRSRMVVVRGRATVDGEVTCEAEMTFMMADADAI
jgi:3-hydroxymyristoyl/3-hydroxydecanoyl-(acyl carrier protein) dehydratase